MEEGRWIKIPQIGRVIIGNDVEIGANTTIDRGALDDTVIEEGDHVIMFLTDRRHVEAVEKLFQVGVSFL